MNRVLVDTNVFLYARGATHPYREPCRQLLDAARQGMIGLDASVELVQEYVHVLLRRGVPRDDAVDEAGEVARQCRLHPFDTAVLNQMMILLRTHSGLGGRDAVHAATAVIGNLDRIVSTDTAFDRLDDIVRIDPADPTAPWVAGSA